MWAATASMYDVHALCEIFRPLCMMYRRYVGYYVLYVLCTGVMWAITSSMYDVQALFGLLHPLCVMYRRDVGCYIL